MNIELPKHFYLDHRARDNGASGKVVCSNKNYITVDLDALALEDLVSDAEVYASFTREDFQENRGLCLSARATLRAITNHLTKRDENGM